MQVVRGNGGCKARGQLRKASHPRIRDGVNAASLKAFTAAKFYLNKIANDESVTLKWAALSHGTNINYVRAAITVLEVGDQRLIKIVLCGDESILAVAKALGPQLKLVKAMADASPAAWTAAARTYGPNQIWDRMVAPLLDAAA